MTTNHTDEITPTWPPSHTLALHLENKFYDLGDAARQAVEALFLDGIRVR